jgi:ribonuclease E
VEHDEKVETQEAVTQASEVPAAQAGEQSADAPPHKKRRRGRRGGKRHKKKVAPQPTASTEETAEQPEGAAQTEPKPETKPRAGGTRPRASKPRAPRAPAARKPAAIDAAKETPAPKEPDGDEVTAESLDLETPLPDGEQSAAKTAARKRRRRGGRGRGKSTVVPVPEGAKPEEPGAVRPPAQPPEPPSSTRLAARAIRQTQQQGQRRPRRKLTEEDARRLRGGQKVMLVHEHDDRTQIAVLEENVLIEHFVARRGGRTSLAGNIFLGKVQNVLPGMEAAFVDFGRGRNGVLYAGEVNYSPEDLEGDAMPRIEQVLKPGQAIMVQVTKDPIGTKGARLTTQISLAGRYMVLAPEQQLTGISRRLSENERTRLRLFLREMRHNSHGVIIRTAAEGASKDALERDLGNLLKVWEGIQKSAKRAKAPHLLYAEPELTMRVVRDIFSGDFTKVVVDSRAVYEDIKSYLEDTAPDLLEKVELHEGALPLFEEFRVTEQLHKALERKVWLPSGGSIVIDRTEAMTVIDVNTGKFTGKGTNLEDTVFKNNLEAAEEIARQLRLRDIGGIIVIDFIDMIDPKNQQELLRTLKRALSRDKTRSQVFDVTSLGLIEMTRKKVSEGLLDAFSEPCPNCEGRGIVLTHEID